MTGDGSLPLGFGCSTLADHASPADALRCLDAALGAGISHFDVARGYGGGHAESLLGQFSKARRERLYIVTKFGLNPVASTGLVRAAHTVAQSAGMGVYGRVRGWARRHIRRPYGPRNLRRSLETSLRELQTDYVDCLLLHEAHIEDAIQEPLLRALQQLQQQGKILSYGIGSEFGKLRDRHATLPPQFKVLQYEHNPLNPDGLNCGIGQLRQVYTHSALRHAGDARERLGRAPELAKAFRRATGVDPREPGALGGLLLAYSHEHNRTGRVVFSTTSVNRLRENVTSFRLYLGWDEPRKRLVRELFEALYRSGAGAVARDN